MYIYEIKKITVEYYKEVEKLLFLRYLRNFISKNEKDKFVFITGCNGQLGLLF